MTSPISSPTDGKLLAVDTSTATGSLALAEFKKGSFQKILGEASWNKKAMHSEVASIELEALLARTGIQLTQIDGFAVNIGPGSFTGLRVGLNLVRALAYALTKPVARFSALEIIANSQITEGERILVATKAVQNFLYAGVFEKREGKIKTLVEPYSTTLDEALGHAHNFKTFIEGHNAPSPSYTARQLVQMCGNTQFFSWNELKPLYIRGSEAEEKLKKGLLKPLP